MKTLEHEGIIKVGVEEYIPVSKYDEALLSERKRSRGKLLLVGGALGLVGAAFIFAAPELGLASALGGAIAGIGSAGVTLLARR